MKLNRSNPWLVGIIVGALGAVLAGIILHYLFQYRKEKKSKTILTASMNNADRLLEKNMTEDALAIYNDMLKAVSEKKDPEVYSRINNNQGICYYNLAMISNKEENLTRAILAFEDALKIRTVKQHPVDYAMTQNNLGIAYVDLSEVRDREENMTKAIRAYEEALKIYTVEKYPLRHKVVMSNMEIAKQKMR